MDASTLIPVMAGGKVEAVLSCLGVSGASADTIHLYSRSAKVPSALPSLSAGRGMSSAQGFSETKKMRLSDAARKVTLELSRAAGRLEPFLDLV